MSFKYLSAADDLRTVQIDALAKMTEEEVKRNLWGLLAPRLKNRVVWFAHSMGQTTVDVEHRRGGSYVITSNDVWWSPPRSHRDSYGYTAIRNPDTPKWVKDVMELISEYSEISQQAFAIEFSMMFGKTKRFRMTTKEVK